MAHLKHHIGPEFISKHFLKQSDHLSQAEENPGGFSIEGDHEDMDKLHLEKYVNVIIS